MKKMFKWSIFAMTLITMLFSYLSIESSDDNGDEKIQETIERIEEEEEKEKEEGIKRLPKEKPKEEDEGVGLLFLDIFFRMLSDLFFQYTFSVRYADYPYAETSDFYFNTSSIIYPYEEEIFIMQLATDFTYHFDNTFSNITKLTLQISAVHINAFNQFIFSQSEWFAITSCNGGLTFSVPNFMFSGYIGLYKLSFMDQVLPSFGFSSQLFLPGKIYLDLYNLNSQYHSLKFVHISASVNYAIKRFNFGAGINYNNYADYIYVGPFVKASFWL